MIRKAQLVMITALIFITSVVQAQKAPKNVQVLKDLSIKEIRTYMKAVSSGIGEKCNYCHDMKAYDKDEKKPKLVAREYLKLVNEINTQVAMINKNEDVNGSFVQDCQHVLQTLICHYQNII